MENRLDVQDSQTLFADLSSLSNDYFSALEHNPASEVVSQLARSRWHDQRAVALALGDDRRINVAARPVKTVGIYYCQIACGGADRVVVDQANILADLGYRIVLITETPIEEDVRSELPEASHVLLSPYFWDTDETLYRQRACALEQCLAEHAIDLVVYNQALSPLVLWDLLLIKAHGASCIAWAHGIFTFPLAEIGRANGVDHRIADMPFVLRLADAVVCANQADKAFWSHFNDAVYQTAYVPQLKAIDRCAQTDKPEPPRIAWVGRFSSEKKPLDAIRIMGEIVKTVPNAVLDMIGPYDEEWEKKATSLIEELSLGGNIVLHGRQKDMAPYYQDARMLLHTSQSESFCLVLFEAKAAGLPCVMYELPYLELAKNGEAGGILSAQQGDVETAARLCVQVLTEEARANELSKASVRDVELLLAYDSERFWCDILVALDGKREVKSLGEDSRLVLNTLCDAYVQALDGIDSVNLANEITIAKLHQEMNGLLWEIGKLHESLDDQQRITDNVRNDLQTLENSTSLRVGRALLWLPTRVKDVVQRKRG